MSLFIQFRSQKFYVLADQVVVSGAAFATNLLLARVLGLAEYGRFASVGLVQLFLLSLSLGAFVQIYQVVYPALSVNQQKQYTTGFFWWQVFFLCILLGVGVSFYSFSPLWFLQYKDLALAGLSASVLYLLQDFIRKSLLTQQKAREAMLCDVVTNATQLLFLAIGWYGHWLTTNTAWWIIASTFLPSIGLGLVWLKPGFPTNEALQFTWQQHKGKAPWLVCSSLLQWGTGYFFVITAGLWLGAVALAALRLSQYIFGLLNVLLQAIESYALPRAGQNKASTAYLQNLSSKSVLIMLPILGLLALFAKQILYLAAGNAYEDYAYVIYGLACVYLLITVGIPVRIAIRSQNLNKEYFTGYILSLLFSVVAAPWLLKNWQLYGVLAGLLGTQLITLSYWYFILQQKKLFIWKSFI